MKTEVHKLDINKLVNCGPILKNFKTNVNDLNVGKLKTVLLELKKLSDVVYNEVVSTTTLVDINQCDTDKQNLEKKLEMLAKNTR